MLKKIKDKIGKIRHDKKIGSTLKEWEREDMVNYGEFVSTIQQLEFNPDGTVTGRADIVIRFTKVFKEYVDFKEENGLYMGGDKEILEELEGLVKVVELNPNIQVVVVEGGSIGM